jgi:hypothetical protein
MTPEAFAFLEGSEDILYCLVSTAGTVLRASLGMQRTLGRDPVGLEFASLQPDGLRRGAAQLLRPCQCAFQDARGGNTTVSVSGREVEGGFALIGSGARVAHSDVLERMSRLENELTGVNRDLQKKVHELEAAREEIRTLSGLLPICMHCKNIRDEEGYWSRVEQYIGDRAGVEFSHGICDDCMKKHYPDEED